MVDDEPTLCRALQALFTERGFHVTTAHTAQQALERIRRVRADVVLLDLRLPDSSGLEVLSKLKAQFPDLRVVMISAFGDEPTIQEAMIRGASDYLAKPFDFDRCFYVAMGLETVDLTVADAEPAALARLPAQEALRHRALPLRVEQDALLIAMADPLDARHLEELEALARGQVKPLAVVGGNLAAAIRRSYRLSAQPSAEPSPAPATETPVPPSEPPSEADQAAARLVREVLQHAHEGRASDLHLGNSPKGPWVRERIDGALYDAPVPPQLAARYADVVSYCKTRLATGPASLPHQGRGQVTLGRTPLDLRISVVPAAQGEHVVIRLLPPHPHLALEQLGLAREQRLTLVSLLAKSSGLLLVTGPSGCGASTTLYTLLAKLNTGQVNLVTVEDQVERVLPGATQIPVRPKDGLTFADGLRASAGHDPDIVMVGELQDQETASLAVRAALTGHLVLAGFHTHDASSAITRLLDFGIEPFFLCSTLSGILAQRLVRKLCPECREPYEVEAASLSHLGIVLPKEAGAVSAWRAKGCPACRQTGYRGRTGLFELLPIDHQIRSLIIKRTSGFQIRQSAISRGMLTLPQAMWLKIHDGETSLEELLQVLPPDLH
ncbi:MAG: Flp pilus assembly complex ATPase component TadA [Candidatus Rokubacteria bacterium]|nr:Flp pilus assembly complex ATPase component TadA [Candidatus Rokubacteria bacterium]